MAIRLVFLSLLFFSCTSKAEENNLFLPQNFYITPFSFDNKTPAPDIDEIIRSQFPKECQLEEIKNDGADYVISLEFIDVKASPMAGNNELIEASLNMSLTYTTSGAAITEKAFKSAVLSKNDDEQSFVYNLIKEMIISKTQSIFNVMCKQP